MVAQLSLVEAAEGSNILLMEQLLKSGAEVDATNQRGQTALHISAEKGFNKMIVVLVKHGASLDAKDNFYGSTPLGHAIYHSLPETVKVLLAAGSGVEVLDGSGGTPLNMSVRFSSAATTEAILAHGCNVNPTNGDGVTPLHVAAEKGKCAHVALLLKYGADVHATHPGGHTALHFAALYGHAEVVRMLLEKGSAIDATNSGGWTPLHAAVRFGRHGAVAALVAAGADKRRKTDEGKSAIFLAHEKGNDADMMALLR